MENDKIVKKINYAVIRFTSNGTERIHTVYGKSNLNKHIKEIVKQYNLQTTANIDVKMITEKRAISLEDFIKHSEII